MEKQENSHNNTIKEDSNISITSDTEEDPTLRRHVPFRERLQTLFHHQKFQIAIVALVLLDTLIVVAELILEARHDVTVHHALHIMSITILSIFLVEICFKIFAFRLEFFHHRLEVFDAVVVALSFGLDIAFWEQEGIELIIVLRLWRVARILNGVVVSVQTQAEHKLLREREKRRAVDEELDKCRSYISALEGEIVTLRSLLVKHDIRELPPTAVVAVRDSITVHAEVNHSQPD